MALSLPGAGRAREGTEGWILSGQSLIWSRSGTTVEETRGEGDAGADAPSESTSYASATRVKMVAASSELSLSGWYLRASLRYLRRAKGGGA